MKLKVPSTHFELLINDYNNQQLVEFNKNLTSLFTPSYVQAKVEEIDALLIENKSTHNYISQIMIETVQGVKNHPNPFKLLNLISELNFANLVYIKIFEKHSQQIDIIENFIVDATDLLNVNKRVCIYIFAHQTNAIYKPCLELLYEAKELLLENTEKAKKMLILLYKSRDECLNLYNTGNQMNAKVKKIHSKFANPDF